MGALIYLICTQLFIFQAVYTQCINRVIQGPNGPIELLPNQMLVPPGVPYLGPLPPGQVYIPGQPQPCGAPTPIPAEYPPSLAPVLTNYPPPPVVTGNVIIPNIPQSIPNLLSGNVIKPNVPSVIPNGVSGNIIIPNAPYTGNFIPNIQSVIPNGMTGNIILPNAPYTEVAQTVVHDNSVANSLANALQLLVVSSLLSNTLPEPYAPPCFDRYIPGYGYVY